MMTGGFATDLSVVVPMATSEDPSWVSDLIATARYECNEILIIVESRADLTAVRPGLGSFAEKVRLIYQTGQGKADALNKGLREAKNQFVVFLDADLRLEPGQLSIVRDLLEDNEFVSVTSGFRVPSIMPIGFVSGWFFGSRRSTFIELSGWAEGYVEDVETAKRISRSGHKITIAPFACKLRRPVRNPVTKLFSVLTSFGRRP